MVNEFHVYALQIDFHALALPLEVESRNSECDAFVRSFGSNEYNKFDGGEGKTSRQRKNMVDKG